MEMKPASQRPMFTNAALRQLIVPLILEQLLAMTVGLAAVVMITKVGEAAVVLRREAEVEGFGCR